MGSSSFPRAQARAGLEPVPEQHADGKSFAPALRAKLPEPNPDWVPPEDPSAEPRV
jgi:hypothetical protein